MREAETYEEFARECRRMAASADANDRDTLLQIAEAWEAQAKAAAEKRGNSDGSTGADGGSPKGE